MTSSAKPRPELFNLEAFWVGKSFQAVSKLVQILVDDFSSGEHIIFPNSRIEMSPEDAQHLWAKEFQDCNLGDVMTHSGDA